MDWKSAINGFKSFMILERSLSDNTVEAYLRDINGFVEFLQITSLDISPLNITLNDLRKYLNELNDIGISSRSQARVISGIKAFYKYLSIEDLIKDDPSELLEAPKIGRKIPEVLSVEEIDEILATFDLSSDLGLRNKAIVETLYACGTRVSELIDLKLSNYYPDVGFIKVIGKNNKERIIPIGDEAIKSISIYFSEYRDKMKIIYGNEDYMFLNRRGRKLTKIMIYNIIVEAAENAGIKRK
ncbi:MAG: tyrosine-type recombinase/integrase [Saprospiraceae bacterium]